MKCRNTATSGEDLVTYASIPEREGRQMFGKH